MSAPLVLAIDIGTSSVRASVYDGRLRARRTVQIKYRWREHTDGRVELDARQLETLVARAIDAVLH
ncbi:MAG: carbohydrate kinase, partial [Acidobacteria bacterium]|nr:carbohydrate kinase [Acidobacteriota bacterium]